jgi:hypothetical protein
MLLFTYPPIPKFRPTVVTISKVCNCSNTLSSELMSLINVLSHDGVTVETHPTVHCTMH